MLANPFLCCADHLKRRHPSASMTVEIVKEISLPCVDHLYTVFVVKRRRAHSVGKAFWTHFGLVILILVFHSTISSRIVRGRCLLAIETTVPSSRTKLPVIFIGSPSPKSSEMRSSSSSRRMGECREMSSSSSSPLAECCEMSFSSSCSFGGCREGRPSSSSSSSSSSSLSLEIVISLLVRALGRLGSSSLDLSSS